MVEKKPVALAQKRRGIAPGKNGHPVRGLKAIKKARRRVEVKQAVALAEAIRKEGYRRALAGLNNPAMQISVFERPKLVVVKLVKFSQRLSMGRKAGLPVGGRWLCGNCGKGQDRRKGGCARCKSGEHCMDLQLVRKFLEDVEIIELQELISLTNLVREDDRLYKFKGQLCKRKFIKRHPSGVAVDKKPYVLKKDRQ